MTSPDVVTNSLLELGERVRHRRAFREERDGCLRGEAMRAPDDDTPPLVVPLEDGAGSHAQAPSDLGRNGDLSLRRDPLLG